MSVRLRVTQAAWEFKKPFRIAYRTRTHMHTVMVELDDGVHVGRGEASGVSYHDETIETLVDQIENIRSEIEAGLTRDALQQRLAPGGARNALDCALWDLEAQRSGISAAKLAGVAPLRPLETAITLGLDSPAELIEAARTAEGHRLLKIKLDGKDDIARVSAVRAAQPRASIIVDANQSWSAADLHETSAALADLGVALIEQPLPVGADHALEKFVSPVPICADESCQTTRSLAELKGKYQFINIKLDKTGGLTEALHLARRAEQEGFRLMVGCMGGSSLAMAPAFLVGQRCEVVDLDAPLLARQDVSGGIRYEVDVMQVPPESLWGRL